MRRMTRREAGRWLLGAAALVPESLRPPAAQAQIRVRTELVVVDAQALDRETGQPLARLAREDFELYEDGVRQQITHFSYDVLPLRIVLLLDASPSVLPILEEIRRGARQALDRLK